MASEDMQNLIAKLQMQTAQAGQPSFAGIQAPIDPGIQQNILQQIQQQNAVDEAGSEPGFGEWNPLFNAGKKDFQRAANAFGDAGQQGANILNGAPQQSPAQTQAASQKQAVMQAKAVQNAILAQGGDPISAQAAGLKILANAGLDVSDALGKNQEAQQKMQLDQSTQAKNTGEVANWQATQANAAQTQARETQGQTWKVLSGSPTDKSDLSPIISQNGLGQIKVEQKAPASAQAAAMISPDARQAMVQSYIATGTPPSGIGRSPAMASQFWSDVANNPQASQAQQILAKTLGQKADSGALAQTTKSLAATGTYINTFDANAKTLQAQADKLNLNDPKVLNAAINAYNKGTSDPDYAKYAVFLNTVGNEYAKIQSGSLGNAPLSDSARHEGQTILPPDIGKTGITAVIDAMRTDSKNKIDALKATQQYYVDKLAGKNPTFPTADSIQAPQPGAAAPAQTLTYDPSTGKFH